MSDHPPEWYRAGTDDAFRAEVGEVGCRVAVPKPTAYEQVMASLDERVKALEARADALVVVDDDCVLRIARLEAKASQSMTFDVATGLRQRFKTAIEEAIRSLEHTDSPCIACKQRESLRFILDQVDSL